MGEIYLESTPCRIRTCALGVEARCSDSTELRRCIRPGGNDPPSHALKEQTLPIELQALGTTCPLRDSNPRHNAPQANALSTELRRLMPEKNFMRLRLRAGIKRVLAGATDQIRFPA